MIRQIKYMAAIVKENDFTSRVILAVAFVSVAPLFISPQSIASIGWFYYGLQILVVNFYLVRRSDQIRAFFSPSSVVANYILFWAFMGGLSFANGWIPTGGEGINQYFELENLSTVTSFILAASAAVGIISTLSSGKSISLTRIPDMQVNSVHVLLIIAILAVTFFYPVKLGFLGGDGSFSAPVTVISSLILSVYAFSRLSSPNARRLIFIVILSYSVLTLFEDKRVIVSLAIAMATLEVGHSNVQRITRKFVLVTILGVVVLVPFVLAISIQRGYGEYETSNFLDSMGSVPNYVTTPDAMTNISTNFEWSRSLFHSANAIDHYLESPDDLLYGSTYIKILFVPIPRYLFENKPNSFIHVYTSREYPEIRAVGGSWPPNAVAEAFGNFHYLGGIVALLLIFYFANIAFNSILKSVRTKMTTLTALLLATYVLFFEYARGYGLDGFTSTVVVLTGTYFVILGISQGIMLIERRVRPKRGGNFDEHPDSIANDPQ